MSDLSVKDRRRVTYTRTRGLFREIIKMCTSCGTLLAHTVSPPREEAAT
jgi:hypothetical protein